MSRPVSARQEDMRNPRRDDAKAHAAHSDAGINSIGVEGNHAVDSPSFAVTSALVTAAAQAAAGETRDKNTVASGTITKKALASARSGVCT